LGDAGLILYDEIKSIFCTKCLRLLAFCHHRAKGIFVGYKTCKSIVKGKPDIIIVDDHITFRQGLTSIITMENIATVIGEASNGVELIEQLAHLKPDLVLLDINMPGMNGMEATQKAMELMPGLKIIAFTMFGDEEYCYNMMDLGVKGFILKSSGINELEKAIQDVMSGKSYFSRELPRKIFKIFLDKHTNNSH
jgi:DNA-binding NarL/FixJ family response regulator